ncbi:hypothetical protein Bca4012_038642 [Brassica carinata]
MGRLVRVSSGQWSKTQQGIWRFNEDRSVMPQDILIRPREPINTLRGIIRAVLSLTLETPLILTFQLPAWMLVTDGDTCPPRNIVTDADVEMMMSMHDWSMEPKICAIFGAEKVARYQFICRTPFTIGHRTFLADGVTEEEHMGAITDIMKGGELICSERVGQEIFGEDKMLLLYRFSFEVEKARNCLDLNLGPNHENDDHIVPMVTNEQTPITAIGGGGGFHANSESGFPAFPKGEAVTNPETTSLYGGLGVEMGTSYGQTPYPPNMTGTGYWERLMVSRYAVELERIYGVVGSENVGYQANNIEIGASTESPTYEAGGILLFGPAHGVPSGGGTSTEGGTSTGVVPGGVQIKVEEARVTEILPPTILGSQSPNHQPGVEVSSSHVDKNTGGAGDST